MNYKFDVSYIPLTLSLSHTNTQTYTSLSLFLCLLLAFGSALCEPIPHQIIILLPHTRNYHFEPNDEHISRQFELRILISFGWYTPYQPRRPLERRGRFILIGQSTDSGVNYLKLTRYETANVHQFVPLDGAIKIVWFSTNISVTLDGKSINLSTYREREEEIKL
jgi:hypothetical protein